MSEKKVSVEESVSEESSVSADDGMDYITTLNELRAFINDLLLQNIIAVKGMGPVTAELLGKEGITSIRDLLEKRIFQAEASVDVFSKAQYRAFLYVCAAAQAKSVGLHNIHGLVARVVVLREEDIRAQLRSECEALSDVVSRWSAIHDSLHSVQENTKTESAERVRFDLNTVMLVTILLGLIVSFYV